MRTLCIIIIPVLILVLFGATFNTEALATRLLRYIEYIGDNAPDLSLMGGYSFDGGFKSASLAVVYIVSLPLRVVWSIFSVIFHTFNYWGVTL